MLSTPPSLPGDIILFSPSKKVSLNLFFQTKIGKRRALHSHVAITIKQGNAIHAMPKVGIQLVGIRELLLDRGEEFIVFRNKMVEGDAGYLYNLEDSLLFYLRQKYNYLFFASRRWNSSFCSELAVKAYRKIGISISNRKPSSTLPLDIFEHIKTSQNWSDVTEIYRDFFLNNPDSGIHDLAARFVKQLEYINQEMAFSQQELADKANLLKKVSKYHPLAMRPSRSYWSNNYTRISRLHSSVRLFRKKFNKLLSR